ncbi:MAG: glycosyltransferase family 4 protein [Thermodesulfobacteriota bacterium]
MKKTCLHIALLTDGQPFHGASPEEQALGGSETACVQMARALAQRGHRVQVFCRCPRPGLYHGVVYRDRADLVQAAIEERFSVAVVSRFFSALDLPLQAGLKALWNHDILDRPGLLATRLESLDICLVLSQFHARDFLDRLPELGDKLALTRNGLDLACMDQAAAGVHRDPRRLAYVSRPERGLKLLLEQIWPRLRAQRPELELHLCGYQVDEADLPPAVAAEHRAIAELVAASPGVVVRGPLAKAAYYRHLASCGLMIYPCVFPEISCIAALEAQALGTPLLTSDAFALAETVVEPGFRVGGAPGSPEYVERFIKQALELLADPRRSQAMAAAARERVRASHDWSAIAAEWEALFLARMGERRQSQRAAVAASLVLAGDRQAAEQLLQRPLAIPEEGPPPADPDEAGLVEALAQSLLPVLPPAGGVGVLAPDQGRTAAALAQRLGRPVQALADGQEPRPELAAVVVRDRLERAADPAADLARALAWCDPDGHVLLCVAAGAWPLLMAGHLARRHDLGREELMTLLDGRAVSLRYLSRGLVGNGPHRYYAGRWLALAPAAGPAPKPLDPDAGLHRARPAPPALLEEVKRAGLV